MKLLGWMHRKFRQNSGEPLRDFVIGQAPSDDPQQYFPRTNINNNKANFKQAQRSTDHLNQRKSIDHQDYELDDESLVSISEIFPGFLAIGTLGSSDPATPKFSISIDNITERETEKVTENELKLINEELEKELLEAADEDDAGAGSRRNSHVSMGRSSHGSIAAVVLSGKALEGPHDQSNSVVNGGGAGVCPLQGYLFGSAVELSETRTVAKKENRTSLGELFQRSKVMEEVGGGDNKDENKDEGDKYGMQLIKKKLKKRMLNAASRRSSTAAGGAFDVSTESKKLHKILQMFNRKVYPESPTMGKEKWDHKPQKNDKKKKTTIDGGVNNYKMKNGADDRTSTDEDIMIFPKKLILKNTLRRYKSQSIPPQFSVDDDGDSNKAQWIKTDAEFLVLEL